MKRLLTAAFVSLGLTTAHADVNFTAQSTGDNITHPGESFTVNSTTHNVLLKIAAYSDNSFGDPQLISQATITVTGLSNISTSSLRLIRDSDGNLLTGSSTRTVTNITGNAVYFNITPSFALNDEATNYIFLVYDSPTTQTDGAVIDASIASVSDLTVDAAFTFDSTPLNSPGSDTVAVIASSYSITSISNQAAGTAFSATVRAVDQYGNLDLDADAVTRITTATVDSAAVSPGGYGPVYPAPAALVSGQRTFTGITFFNAAPSVRLGAEYDGSGTPNLSAAGVIDSNAFAVSNASAVLKFQTVSSPQTAGTPFNVFVDASSDTYGNLTPTAYLSGRQLAVNGNSGEPPLTSPFGFAPVYGATQTFGSAGLVYVGTFSVTLFDYDPDVWLYAEDPGGVLISTESNMLAVNAAAVNAFSMDTITSTPIAGVAFPVTVRVSDQYGNADGASLGGNTAMVLQEANDSSAPGNALTGETPIYPGTVFWNGESSRTVNVTLYARENSRRLRARSNPEGTIQTSTSNFFNVWAATTSPRYEFDAVPTLTAGILHQTTVTVRDAFRNVIASPNFANLATRQLAIGSNASASPSGQAPVYEATYTWTGAESGTTLMDVTLFRVQTGTATLSANDPTGFITSTQSVAFSVQHGTSAAMEIASISGPLEAGDNYDIHVRISSDTYGNAGIPLGNYTGAQVQLGGAAGFSPGSSVADGQAGAQAPSYSAAQTWGSGPVNIATFTVNLKLVETGRRLAATESGVTGKITAATSNSFDVTHCSTHHIHVDVPANAVAGTSFVSTVTVHDPFNNVVQNYGGTFTWQAAPSAGGNVLPGNGSPTNGVLTGSVTLVAVGVSSVNVYDVAYPSTLSSTGTVTVGFAGTKLLTLAVSTNQVAGTAFGSTVTVVDSFNNVFTSYAGTVTFASGDSQFIAPALSTTVPGGQRFLNGFVLKTAGNQTFGVSDNAGSASTSTVIGVALSSGRFITLTIAATAVSGQDLSPVVRIVDDFSNIDTASTATVRLTSSDGAATLPPDTALVNGQKTVSLILRTAGGQTVTAADVSTPSIAVSTTSTVSVSAPTAPAGFGFTIPTSLEAGKAFTFTIESRDQFGNRTNYTGPGTLSLAAGRFEVLQENGSAIHAAPGLRAPVSQIVIQFVNGLWTGQVVLRGEVARPNFSVTVNGVSATTEEAGLLISNVLPYLEDTIVYPNPFRPAQHGQTNIRFYDPSGSSSARVVIYTFDWQKVREWNLDLSAQGSDVLKRLVWDGKDESGNDVAPGVYLCVTEVGGRDKRSKLAVIR